MANQNGGSLSLIETVEKITGKVIDIAGRIPSTLKGGPVILVVIVLVSVVAGGGISWELHPTPDAITSIGIIENATVTRVYDRISKGHHTDDNLIDINFPKPANCDNDTACQGMLTDILGTDSCPGQECSATLKDVDEGQKDNSTDIRRHCDTYKAHKETVLILFSGKRNQKK